MECLKEVAIITPYQTILTATEHPSNQWDLAVGASVGSDVEDPAISTNEEEVTKDHSGLHQQHAVPQDATLRPRDRYLKDSGSPRSN